MTETQTKPMILITRPPSKAQDLAEQLSDLEAEILIAPAQTTAAVQSKAEAQELINRSRKADYWIFVSAPAVEHGLAMMDEAARTHLNGRCVAVGPATAAALAAQGVEDILVPEDHRSEGLLRIAELQDPENGSGEVVIVNAAGGRQLLIHELAARGFQVTEIHVYQRVACSWSDELWEILKAADDLRIVATSAGAVQTLFNGPSRGRRAALREAHWILPSERVQVVCAGFGVTRFSVAANAGNQALAAAIREHS